MGDERIYSEAIALRAVDSVDGRQTTSTKSLTRYLEQYPQG